MFIFGHIGITLGIFYLLSHLFSKDNSTQAIPYIIIGALLPDIIDKPLGRIVFAETIGSGRIFAHTLIFGILLGLTAYYFYKQGKPEFMIVAGSSFCHILQDHVWNNPEVFLWPLFGWKFPRDTISGNFIDYLLLILTRSWHTAFTEVFISEIAGLLIILFLTGKYIQSKMKNRSTAHG